MNWTKLKGALGKVEPFKKFLKKEQFIFQSKTSIVILDHDIPSGFVVNLDQTFLFYVSPGKYSYSSKGLKNVPIKGLNDKRQIKSTFVVTTTDFFLLI